MSPTHQMGQAQGALTVAADRVAVARHDFDDLDRELVHHLEAARTQWSGRGGSAFQSLGLAWAERQRTITRALDDFALALRATERDNTATDEAQSSAFAGARQRLG